MQTLTSSVLGPSSTRWLSGRGLVPGIFLTVTIAAPDHPWQSWKAFPDGSVAWAGVASASSTITVARVMPCN